MIVFLDIDGPVQSCRSGLAGFNYDPVAAILLNEFFAQPNVKVVISSTVRALHDNAEDMRDHLYSKYGLIIKEFHPAWKTGVNYGAGDGNREREIREWLLKHFDTNEQYVAIDDDAISIAGMTQIKADYNGIPYIELLRLRSLYDVDAIDELRSWEAWAKDKCLELQRPLT
jgi:hypothetical protein